MGGFSAIGDWDVSHFVDPDLPGAFHDGDIAIFIDARQAAFFAMFADALAVFIHAEKSDITVKPVLHPVNEVIVRIQDRIAMGENTLRHYSFYLRHLFNGINSTKADMICTDVCNDGNITVL